jgi:hypothetical protein
MLNPGDRPAQSLHAGRIAGASRHPAQGGGLVTGRLGPDEPVDGVALGVADRENPRDDEAKDDEHRRRGDEDSDATGP